MSNFLSTLSRVTRLAPTTTLATSKAAEVVTALMFSAKTRLLNVYFPIMQY